MLLDKISESLAKGGSDATPTAAPTPRPVNTHLHQVFLTNFVLGTMNLFMLNCSLNNTDSFNNRISV